MPFVKGQKKTGGRKVGSINKTTAEQKERIETVLNLLYGDILKSLNTLDFEEKTKMWVTLQEYVVPKLARTELSGDLNISTTISETTNFKIKPRG